MSPSSMSRPNRLSFQSSTQLKPGWGSRARATISCSPGRPSKSVPLMPTSLTTSQVAPAAATVSTR